MTLANSFIRSASTMGRQQQLADLIRTRSGPWILRCGDSFHASFKRARDSDAILVQMAQPPLELDIRARETRLYDRLRARVVSGVPGARSGLRDLLLMLPDLVVLLGRLARDRRVPASAKVIALIGISYALSPLDLLPDLLLGPLGMIDDLLVVVAALSRILNQVHPDLVRSHWSGQEDLLIALQRVTDWAASWMGRVVARALGFRPTGLKQ